MSDTLLNWRINQLIILTCKTFGLINKLFEQIKDSFAQIKDSFGRISTSFEQIKDSFGRISKSFEQIKDSFGRISKSCEQIKDSFRRISKSLGQMYQNLNIKIIVVDIKIKFVSLSHRLETLKIPTHSTSVLSWFLRKRIRAT